MPDKRETSVTVKLSEYELLVLRQTADDCDMDLSEFVRACIALALPTLTHVPFARRVRLEDNTSMTRKQ